MPSAAQYKALILMEIGEQDNSMGPVADSIDVLWSMQEGKAGGDIERQYLLTKIKAISITIGAIWRGQYQKVGGIQKDALDDKTNFLRSLLSDVQSELDNLATSFRLNLDYLEP